MTTNLVGFYYVDFLDDHEAAHVNKLMATSLYAEYCNVETLTADLALFDIDCQFQLLTASGADRTVKLSPEAITNHVTIILNNGASNNIVVKDDSAAITFATLAPQAWAMFLPFGGTSWKQAFNAFPAGHLFGLTLSNNASDPTNDIDIAVGRCRDSVDAANMVLAAALTKRLDAAWAVGSGNGGLDTGSIADTTYHVWLIKRSDTGVVDALFSTSASAPTMPANYDLKRRIGSIFRTGAAIKGFVQDGDSFMWKVPSANVAANNPGTAAVTRTLTVPVGIRVKAIVTVAAFGNAAGDDPINVFVSDLSITDTAPGNGVLTVCLYRTAAGSAQLGGSGEVFTNISGQVRSRIQNSTAGTTLYINTNGYVDTRGRLS